MARIANNDADKYVPSNSGEWFVLKNDGDTAKVQFMFADCSELDVFTAHKVQLNGKERYVNCPREYGEDLNVCPLCRDGYKLNIARFVVMYCLDDGKVKIWERGKQFIIRLEGLANRYYPLYNTVFEIERHGRPGDTQTTYEIYPCPNEKPIDLNEIEKPELLGSIVLDKSVEDMEYYIENAVFPNTDTNNNNQPANVRRRPAVENNREPVTSRRSPSRAETVDNTSRRSRRG